MKLITQNTKLRLFGYIAFMLCSSVLLGNVNSETIIYYLYIADFAQSFIEIPTSNVSGSSTTIASSYLAGRAPIYDTNNRKFGTCSASFLSMQTADGIFTDISNYLAADNGLIVTWFTPTKLINLELDSIIHGMVTECIVSVTTKIGFSPFYGQTYNLIVSSDGGKIYFKFTPIGSILPAQSNIVRALTLKYCH
jgi:hypothetical protein